MVRANGTCEMLIRRAGSSSLAKAAASSNSFSMLCGPLSPNTLNRTLICGSFIVKRIAFDVPGSASDLTGDYTAIHGTVRPITAYTVANGR